MTHFRRTDPRLALPGRFNAPADQSRRDVLRRLGLTGAALALPSSLLAACGGGSDEAEAGAEPVAAPSAADLTGTKIKVATFGGFFEENYKAIYPDFTAETGIEVESISEPGGGAWLIQVQQAVAAGTAPADVSMFGNVDILKASTGGLLMGYSASDLANATYQAEGFVRTNDADEVIGVGAASWYITLVSNTDRVPESPTSWKTLWDSQWLNDMALNNQAQTSFLLDITANTWFDEGTTMLETEEGILEVMAKIAELKDNVKLWWRDEATAQQDYNSGEVAIGQFYHDITQYAASIGEPLRSVFPEEGAVLDSGSWAITKTTEQPEASLVFIDWFSQPTVQERLATTLGTSPTVGVEHLELTAEDYEMVSGPGPDAAIKPYYTAYQEREDWINQQWSEQIFAG